MSRLRSGYVWVLSRLFALLVPQQVFESTFFLDDAQIQPPQEVGLRARKVNFGIYLTLNMPSSSSVDGVERLAADHVINPFPINRPCHPTSLECQ